MNARLKDGSTVRQNDASAWEQSGIKPQSFMDADASPLPYHARHLWALFGALHRRRRYTETGPEPIEEVRLAARAALMRIRLDPWEVEAILAVDDVFLAASAEASKKPQGS